jgi:hypothetical protein
MVIAVYLLICQYNKHPQYEKDFDKIGWDRGHIGKLHFNRRQHHHTSAGSNYNGSGVRRPKTNLHHLESSNDDDSQPPIMQRWRKLKHTSNSLAAMHSRTSLDQGPTSDPPCTALRQQRTRRRQVARITGSAPVNTFWISTCFSADRTTPCLQVQKHQATAEKPARILLDSNLTVSNVVYHN